MTIIDAIGCFKFEGGFAHHFVTPHHPPLSIVLAMAMNIGNGNRGARGPWPLLNLRPLHRIVIFAIENHFSLAKWPPLTFSSFLRQCQRIMAGNSAGCRQTIISYRIIW